MGEPVKNIAVIGAGPAGLMAAVKAAERGFHTVIIEKNSKTGKKLLTTGKGRCNITNSTDVKGLIENIPGNGNFLYSTFSQFSNIDLINFFENNGLKTKIERGGRVFPESDKSSDIHNTLINCAKKNKVRFLINSCAKGIEISDEKVVGVLLENGSRVECNSVILATGGASYPDTGSTGDGYKIAEMLGHRIVKLKPSLVPLVAEEKWVADLQGLSLKNISINLKDKTGKKIYEDFGEMLFTHFGVSGPVILSASRHIMGYGYKDIKLVIDLKPALSEEKLYERLQRDFEIFSNKAFKNSLDELLPEKMISTIVKLSCIAPFTPVNQITREERKRLVYILKNFEINITGSRHLEEAIITAGGVSVDEINPTTMESKLIKGLFFAGEIIDVDGYTGGFNLTIAFATGYVAGSHC